MVDGHHLPFPGVDRQALKPISGQARIMLAKQPDFSRAAGGREDGEAPARPLTMLRIHPMVSVLDRTSLAAGTKNMTDKYHLISSVT
jgi:hypothetical protein